MHIKSWPYWLRGGVLGVIVVLFAITYMVATGSTPGFLIPIVLPVILVLGVLGLFAFYSGSASFAGSINNSEPLILMVSLFLIWFIIGAVIGAIFGGIKNRKKPVSTSIQTPLM